MERMAISTDNRYYAHTGRKDPPVTGRLEKIRKLAAEIEAGAYEVRIAEIADRILQELWSRHRSM